METLLAQVSLDSIPAHPWFWEALMGPEALRGPAVVQRTHFQSNEEQHCPKQCSAQHNPSVGQVPPGLHTELHLQNIFGEKM